MNKASAHIKDIILGLPETPGVYQYINSIGEIIYIGKAKNLKRRVSSYFGKVHEIQKVNVLVKNIATIKYLVVKTEEEALHLECNLIKEYKPRYNVLLKDDKSYPLIAISNEDYPKVFVTRNIDREKAIYFGPYSNSYLAKTMVELIKNIFPIRSCNLDLSSAKLEKSKYKPCLEYHLKRCKAPCIRNISTSEYQIYIHSINKILKGDIDDVIEYLSTEMDRLAELLRFEEANEIKEKYQLIQTYKAKSIIVNPLINDVDIYSYSEDENNSYINCLMVKKGRIIRGFTLEYKKQLAETKEEVLSLSIIEFRERFQSNSKEIIVPFLPDVTLSKITYTIPQKGDKRKLLELSENNVKQYKIDKEKSKEKLNPEQKQMRILTKMQKDLGLSELPMLMECFDNSNIQGTNPVAACVVFKMGKPSKKDYRLFHIKTVEGANDVASMKEVLYRRYKRVIEEDGDLPNLIIVDGGKGQLNAAVEVLTTMQIINKVAVIGLAKRLEEVYIPNHNIPIYIGKKSETLRVIQHIRDESHRFGITFHRKIRSQKQVKSELDEIKGIGTKTISLLLSHYKSIKRIKETAPEELIKLIGKSKTQILFYYLHNKK